MNNENLLRIIIKFLQLKDIINLSLVNRNLNLLLNNETNHIVNNLWKEQCDNDFYHNGIRDKITNKDYFLNEHQHFFNWKELYKKIVFNKSKFKNEKITNEIYEIMKMHIFLPKIRKNIEYLENDFFSKHQIFFIDNKKVNFQNANLNNIEIIEYYKQFIDIFENIFSYQNLNKYDISTIQNNEIQFIVWLYQTISLYCSLNYEYINSLDKDKKIFINEYIERYNDLVDIALLLEERFCNLKNKLNLIYNNIFEKKSNFSIYIMVFNIWYNQVYLKFINYIFNSITFIFDEYLKNKFKNENSNSTNITFFQNNNDDLRDNYNLINEIGNSILDFSIDSKNVMFINHTNLKVNVFYEEYENILLYRIENFLKNEIFIQNDWEDNLFEWFNNFFFFDEENELFSEEKSIYLISRTKYFLFNKIIDFINPYVKAKLDKIFINYINKLNITELIDCHIFEDNLDLSDIVKKKIENEEKNIKNYLKELSSKQLKNLNDIDKIINNFKLKNGKSIFDFIFQLSKKYYQIIEQMESLNNKITKITSGYTECSKFG